MSFHDDDASVCRAVVVVVLISVMVATVAFSVYIITDHGGAVWREYMADNAANEYAEEYVLANRVAQDYDLAGDGWMSAVAHERAAEAAGDAAEMWTKVLEALIDEGDFRGRDAHVRHAEAEASMWMAAQVDAYWLAAEAAAGAGRGAEADVLASKAADALTLKVDVQFDLAAYDERRDISVMMDALAMEGTSPRESRSMRP